MQYSRLHMQHKQIYISFFHSFKVTVLVKHKMRHFYSQYITVTEWLKDHFPMQQKIKNKEKGERKNDLFEKKKVREKRNIPVVG